MRLVNDCVAVALPVTHALAAAISEDGSCLLGLLGTHISEKRNSSIKY